MCEHFNQYKKTVLYECIISFVSFQYQIKKGWKLKRSKVTQHLAVVHNFQLSFSPFGNSSDLLWLYHTIFIEKHNPQLNRCIFPLSLLTAVFLKTHPTQICIFSTRHVKTVLNATCVGRNFIFSFLSIEIQHDNQFKMFVFPFNNHYNCITFESLQCTA